MPTGCLGREQRGERVAVAPLRSDRVLLALDDRSRHRRLELVDATQQGAELEAAEELAHGRPVGRLGQRLLRLEVERQVALDRRQQLRSLGVLAVLDQRLAPLLPRHRVDVRVDALERSEADEQVGRGLVADARARRECRRRCRP